MNHQSPDVTLDDAFTWFTSRIQEKIDLIALNTQEKQQIASGVLQKNEALKDEIQSLNLDAKKAEIEQSESMLQQQSQELNNLEIDQVQKQASIRELEKSMQDEGAQNLLLEAEIQEIQQIIQTQPISRANADQILAETREYEEQAK